MRVTINQLYEGKLPDELTVQPNDKLVVHDSIDPRWYIVSFSK